MEEIRINLFNLSHAINRLNSLTQSWTNDITIPPAVVGGGQTVNELETLVKLYQDMHTHMITLASNTASFLTNVGESFQASDHKAFVGMGGGMGGR